MMLPEDRLVTFIRSLDSPLPKYLEKIRKEAVRTHVPIIRPEMVSLIGTLLELKDPCRILEIGCAVGFSALWMAHCTGPDCQITTVEMNRKRMEQARKNFDTCPGGEKIRLVFDDAANVISRTGETFDFIFLDAAKGQYQLYYPQLRALLKEGGVLLCDNVLQSGDLLESRYAVERRNRTIHKRMRGFLFDCMHDPAMRSTVLPVADGAVLCIKKWRRHEQEQT